jgi:hypothetical protein
LGHAFPGLVTQANPSFTVCMVLTAREIKKGDAGALVAGLSLDGKWTGFQSDSRGMTNGLILARGCSSVFNAGLSEVTFIIQEDRLHDLRGGVGISVTGYQIGYTGHKAGC